MLRALYPSWSHSKREYRNYDAEGDGESRWSSHYQSHTIVARKTRCYSISYPYTCGDRSRLARIHPTKKIDPRSRPVFPWSWDCWISIQGYHYLQGKRDLGTKFFFHTSKNEIQLRGLTYSEVSKRGRLILLASSLANNMRICSTTPS